MIRKGMVPAVVTIIAMILSITSFASDLDILYDRDIESTEEFLVSIVRPEGDETTSKKSYVICGNTDVDDIRVHLMIADENGNFTDFKNTDGESFWDVGASGIFMKEIIFPKEDRNRIRIAAYKKSEVDRLVPGENLQINDYNITVLPEGFFRNFFSNFRVTDFLSNIVK